MRIEQCGVGGLWPQGVIQRVAWECAGTDSILGESPWWDQGHARFGWIDVVGRTVRFATEAALGKAVDEVASAVPGFEVVQLDRAPLCVVSVARSESLLIGTGRRLASLTPEGSVVPVLQVEPSESPRMRLNDGRCDAAGRLWVSSMAVDLTPGVGVLYRIGLDRSVTATWRGLTLPNGIDWSPDGRRIYLADSASGWIYIGDFDVVNGTVGPRSQWLRPPGPGVTDGLCVDSDGNVWVALWGGAAVLCYSPAGELLTAISLPCAHPTSCCFGGADLETLMITTACVDDASGLLSAGGRVLVCNPGKRGRPAVPFAGFQRA
ncbi:SMP-30/gluconolactonase/LRE family protein [Nocardioides terrisoli]|uniref:SMP-30/gluconolactonase/LRE family protein n=1 Tax=Nocardioides terrisoli TaxID=3388267 RepID=UPI00287BC80A|nr:SMP-30/gluconolactonase/LRE family protein [Nocardioides marmorisolisilvae]